MPNALIAVHLCLASSLLLYIMFVRCTPLLGSCRCPSTLLCSIPLCANVPRCGSFPLPTGIWQFQILGYKWCCCKYSSRCLGSPGVRWHFNQLHVSTCLFGPPAPLSLEQKVEEQRELAWTVFLSCLSTEFLLVRMRVMKFS